MKDVLILLADGFEDVEALAVSDFLKRADISFDLVGVNSKEIISSTGVKLMLDIEVSSIKSKDYKLLFLPGGRGVKMLEESDKVKELILDFEGNRKPIAAICAAPSLLGKLGLLKNKEFTCFPGFEEHIPEGIHKIDGVVNDGRFITGKSVGYSFEFALEIIEFLKGKGKREEVEKRTLLKEKML